MKTAIVLAFALLQAAPARAESANQAANREARRFFVPCSTYAGDIRKLCDVNHRTFLDNYVLAKSGDPMWMMDIALRLDQDPDSYCPECTAIGIRQDKRQACAWIIVTAESATTSLRLAAMKERYAAKCGKVSLNEDRAIDERADVLLAEMRDNPATAPVDKPLTAAEQRCLDIMACSLNGECERPPPKPGCPRR